MNPIHRWSGAVLLGSLVFATSEIAAQAVRVRATEGGRAVAGALISVSDGDATVARTLTDEGGRALLPLPRAGRFALRADRIGYAGITGIVFEVRGTDTASVAVEMPGDRVLLPEISVAAGSSTCRLDREESSQLSLLWAEVTKVLQRTEVTRTSLEPLLEITRFERDLNPELQIRAERSTRQQTRAARPFMSVEPARLIEDGFVVKQDAATWFYGPDAPLLLSNEFMETHCFRAVPSKTPGDGLIGLGFEPTRGRRVPEITGVLWLHRESAELRLLEFQFVEFKGRTGHEGGRVEFARLPGGGWIVSDWVIRMPVLVETRGNAPFGGIDPVVGFRETGGTAQLLDLAPTNRAIVAGVVYDSILGRPLPGVEVSLGGSAYRATTDSAGVYQIETTTQGSFLITTSHPRFTSLGIEPKGSATLTRGRTATANIATPAAATLLQGCAATTIDSTARTMLSGVVRDSAGQAIPGARLDLSWGPNAARRLVARADGDGRYRVCGLPTDSEIWFRGPPSQVASPHWVALQQGVVTLHDVVLQSAAAARGANGVQIIVQADSTPVADALIRLHPLGDTVRTDREGRARFEGVTHGRYLLDVRALGYQLAGAPLEVREGGNAESRIGLARVAQQLANVETTAAAPSVRTSLRMADLALRRRSGSGRFIMRDELARRPESQMTDVLRRLPGVRFVVLPVPCTGFAPASMRRGVGEKPVPCMVNAPPDAPHVKACLMSV
ncbi:MAG: carboxypeptidase regulatory-like domain-containing protein [Gemmatimonadales bacterium]